MRSLEEHDELALTAVTAVVPDGEDGALANHLQLLVIGDGTFATYPLLASRAVTIGRSSGCDIAINDHSISRRHAALSIGDTVTIEDLGSANGTVVRGNRLAAQRPIEIAVGELVGLGSASIILQRRSQPAGARMVWTHEHFEARLKEECAREARSGAPFALLRICPSRRAPPGSIEETLDGLLRDSDILGKFGPHAYEVLLLDTTPVQTDDAVRRLESNLIARGIKCGIFVACCPRDGRSPYQLAAKAQGPNIALSAARTDVVVADAQMQSLYRLVEQIAVSDICVLLLGETGVGKEVFARALHRASPRAAGPFVELNCAALTETLLESELFGHERGAFTNAVAAKPGLLETAHGGTVFLDEIGDMPLGTQAKLLRVIEDLHVRRVGGVKSLPIDVRFVAATNCDLDRQVAQGAFRRDLFFRLNGITLVIPPLRERTAEIEPLARAFIARTRRDPELAADAIEALKRHGWPGNVRELKNVVERAVLLCGDGPILPEHVAIAANRVTPLPTAPRALQPRRGSTEERQWITQALERAGGNQTVAARLLGISRRTLVNRLNEYDHVERPRKGKLSRD